MFAACTRYTHALNIKIITVQIITYQTQSTKPPLLAITDFTRSANFSALSPGSLVIAGKYQTSATIAQLVMMTRRYCIMLCFELFQNASPNHGLYCYWREKKIM